MILTAVIDPITRIEGHLKIEIDIDYKNGVRQIVDARAHGTLFRGFENLLVGRDPRDAQHITERICGVCPVAHGMTAVLALDQAFGVSVPTNARIMRNLVNGANFIDSHILHFYLLCLVDFMDGPAMPPWTPTWRVDKRFSKASTDGLVQNYLQAIVARRKAHEMGALFGGRLPHPPAYIVGGFTTTPRPERIAAFKAYLNELIPFIQGKYIPDAEMLGAMYPDYFSIGRGFGNLLSYGAFELNNTGTERLFQSGVIMGSSTSPQPFDASQITESIKHSWYSDSTNDLHPSVGDTVAEKPKDGAYSWVKAPRYRDLPFEVGPIARMMVNGEYTNGVSVMDRHLSRAKEALKIALKLQEWVELLDPAGPVYTPTEIPNQAMSAGLTEAPRGALGHWMSIADKKISRYQVITPTAWNASPRDTNNYPGPLEQSLIGTPVENPDEPIEALRVIHSVDPCLDCAVHVMRPGGKSKVVTLPHTHGEPHEEHSHGHSHSHGHVHSHDHSHSH